MKKRSSLQVAVLTGAAMLAPGMLVLTVHGCLSRIKNNNLRERTVVRINELTVAMRLYAIVERRLPGPDFRACIAQIKSHPHIGPDYRIPGMFTIEKGDAWGREIVVEITRDGRGATIRSAGPDGVFDTRGGDDVVRTFTMPSSWRGPRDPETQPSRTQVR